jgi:hypothetical protein
MGKQDAINWQGERYIQGLRHVAGQLWRKACDFDGIATDSRFVVFSKENKFAAFYNQAMLRLSEARQEFADGGYVGLRIQKGRAQ